MESSLSDLQFSVSEFEQAGLLPDLDNEFVSGARASPAPHAIDGPTSGVESTSESGNLTQDSGLVRPVVSDQNLLPGPWNIPDLLHASSAASRDVQHQHPGPTISIEPYSKKQQQNREHQKRFRQRQKARTKVVENQLASTLTELQELRIHKQQLDQELQQAQGSRAWPTSQSVAHCETENLENADSDPDVAPSLTISIQGRRQQVTAEEILTMPAEQYAMLWKAYTTELKSCLQLCANARSPAEESRMNQLTFETIMLRDNRLKTDVNSARFMSSEPASFFAELLTVLSLSEEQVQDLMLLRRLFIVKRCLLGSQRARLVVRMQEPSPDLISDALKASSVATQLGNNAAQDRQLFHRFTWGVYCGILSAKQSAEVIVHAGPQQCMVPSLLTHIAHQKGFPSNQHIKDTADGIAIADEWAHVWRYTEAVNPYVTQHVDYVPIWIHRHKQAAVLLY